MGPKLEVAARHAAVESIYSFARDIAPVPVDNCLGCHGGTGNNPGGKLNMATFAVRLLKGGDSGNEIEPGKPADSLLLKKLEAERRASGCHCESRALIG